MTFANAHSSIICLSPSVCGSSVSYDWQREILRCLCVGGAAMGDFENDQTEFHFSISVSSLNPHHQTYISVQIYSLEIKLGLHPTVTVFEASGFFRCAVLSRFWRSLFMRWSSGTWFLRLFRLLSLSSFSCFFSLRMSRERIFATLLKDVTRAW